MWLLSTDRAELCFFTDPSNVPGGYAILSHTWMGNEQLFQDLQVIRAHCDADGTNPRDHVSPKIRNCCIEAERYGHRWVWIDSCCIDKTSSVELSEAINSMFNWYVLSEVCFAYLEDVPYDDDLKAADSAFRRARWHTRGWTLQELLAPTFVIFMSREWKRIGTKLELAPLLSEITTIYTKYITREYSFVTDAPIGMRMAWASKRTTTRIEDEAYCLLGLFDVKMSTSYGEGRLAFQRLQQELVKQSLDTSLFAWGRWHDEQEEKLPAASLQTMWSSYHSYIHHERFVFAPSPSAFTAIQRHYTPALSRNAAIQPYLPRQWPAEVKDGELERRKNGPFGTLELPSFEVTNHGLKCRFPVAEVDGITIAVLLAENYDQHLGLLLHPAEDDELTDPSRQMYYVTWAFQSDDRTYYLCRLALLGNDLYDLKFRGKTFKPAWKDLYIRASPRSEDSTDPYHLILRFTPDRTPPVPFRLPRWIISALARLQFYPTTNSSTTVEGSSWHTWSSFGHVDKYEGQCIVLGQCSRSTRPNGRPHAWAWAQPRKLSNWNEYDWRERPHDCAVDHIDTWPEQTKEFGDEERTIRLSFAPCPLSPDTTYVMHLGLLGSMYEGMTLSKKVTLLGRTELSRILGVAPSTLIPAILPAEEPVAGFSEEPLREDTGIPDRTVPEVAAELAMGDGLDPGCDDDSINVSPELKQKPFDFTLDMSLQNPFIVIVAAAVFGAVADPLTVVAAVVVALGFHAITARGK